MVLPSAPSLLSRPSRELAESPSSKESLPKTVPAIENYTFLHTNSNTPNTVSEADLSGSLSLALSLLPSLFTCSWCERVSASPGWVPSYEWMEMREGCEREQKRVGRVRKKERGRCDACSRRMENKRQYHFLPAGFPVGVNWGRVQQKVDS